MVKEEKRTDRKGLIAYLTLGGALLASSCCVIPFLLFILGISGAWIGNLTALAPYQPYFVAFTLLCLGASFYFVYRKPKEAIACDQTNGYCQSKTRDTVLKVVLWVSVLIVAITLAWPLIVPYLL